MLFDYDLLVPNGTLQTAPAARTVKLVKGRIVNINVIFPPGPARLVYVVVLHNLLQLVPANPEGSLHYDDVVVRAEMDYPLPDQPYELRLIGWSPNAVFEHNISFQFDLVPSVGDTWEQINQSLLDNKNA